MRRRDRKAAYRAKQADQTAHLFGPTPANDRLDRVFSKIRQERHTGVSPVNEGE